MILPLVVFASLGVAMEVVFTALLDYPKTKDSRLKGYSYVWMLPIYALVPVFMARVYEPLSSVPLPLRLSAYVAMLLAVEYASGWLIKALTGSCPWEEQYRGKRWAVHGLIRLDYAPAWALACLIFERVYLALPR